ncbi:hypothetical protein GQF04_13260 [Paenibacillus aceris]|uniref:Uncharacterized protein n=2 Tax=Paenibacillus aceris TaxID=869555 RepID=A0ABS4I9K5_9BACL|nr:hypothetical protein [Paenibacillus aceris]MBP1967166.1 hypothetical protein [Paenibacillus aceris]NHW35564.1 hypothetical protein [Paenibacillus aceris]
MNTSWASRITRAALVMTLSFAPMTTTTVNASSSESQNIGSISPFDSMIIELNQVTLLPDQAGSTVTFTLTVRNNGNSDQTPMDYWMRLKSKSGSRYNVQLMPSDKNKSRVPANSSKQFTYYSKVESGIKLQDLEVEFYKLDFSQPNFERSLGQIPVPASYSGVTPADEGSIIQVDGNDIQAKIHKFSRGKNEKNYLPGITLSMENVGDTQLTLPDYRFAIRTSEGLVYPLNAKNGKDTSINPKEAKELQLSGTIPISVNPDDWELLITQSVTDLKMNTLVSDIKLPPVIQVSGGEPGQEYQFSDKSGEYTAQLNESYRLPWEDQDILNANVKLINKGSDSLPIPNMTAYFLLDNSVKVEVKLVQTDKAISINAGSSIDFQAVGKIPYTTQFDHIKLVLQEKESDTQTIDLVELTGQSDLQAIPFIGSDSSYKREDIGCNSKYTVSSINTYTGPAGDLLSAELEVDNLEKRFNAIAPMVAHFRAADGTIFPAQVSEITNPIGPSGKARFHVWTTLPQGYTTENMQIILGDAVTITKDDKQEVNKPDAYVKPVSFGLPVEKNDVKNTLKQIELFPYTISMSRIGTSIDTGKFYLNFDYDITKNSQTVTNTEGHKLVLVFDDHSGNVSFERSYNLKDFENPPGDKTTETESNQLKLGKKQSFTISVNDQNLIYKTEFLKKYNLSIYDEFNGQRKLLGKQSIDWFVYSD